MKRKNEQRQMIFPAPRCVLPYSEILKRLGVRPEAPVEFTIEEVKALVKFGILKPEVLDGIEE